MTRTVSVPPFPVRLARFAMIAAIIAAGGYVFSRLVTLGEPPAAGSRVAADEVIHLHGIGLNPGDDRIFVATHSGLLRVSASGEEVVRVADRFQDTMGFLIVGPDEFLASGHPDLREGLPPRLGLIRSDDAGQTWMAVTLAGEADLHALVLAPTGLYAADSTSQRLIRSSDGGLTWSVLADIDLAAFAVSPDGEQLVGAGSDGALVLSADGGRTWAAVEGPRLQSLTWDADVGPIGAAPDGSVYSSSDGRAWSKVGQLPGTGPVLTAVEGEVIAATDGAVISRSSDGGRTWTAMP